MNEIYFENVLDIGNLYLEKIFNEFEGEYITFVCNDINDTKYFCVCYEFRTALKWIICKVTPETLGKLLIHKIDIKSVFDIEKKNLIQIIYNDGKEVTQKISMYDVKESIFPQYGIYLKPEQDISKYLYYLGYNYIKTTSYKYKKFYDYSLNTSIRRINDVQEFTEQNINMIIPYNLDNVTKYKNKELCFINLDKAA